MKYYTIENTNGNVFNFNAEELEYTDFSDIYYFKIEKKAVFFIKGDCLSNVTIEDCEMYK